MIPERSEHALKTGDINVASGTIRAALINDSIDYTPDPVNHEFVADVFDEDCHVASEFDDTNYSRQTVSVAAKPWGSPYGHIDAEDITWEELGGTQFIQAVLIYKQVGEDDSTPADDPILTIIDGSMVPQLPMETNGADITIAWHPRGLFEYTNP